MKLILSKIKLSQILMYFVKQKFQKTELIALKLYSEFTLYFISFPGKNRFEYTYRMKNGVFI